jgi:hypothetical protein
VHALDTVGRTAACIDLHMLEGRGHLSGFQLEFGPGGEELVVNGKGGEPAAAILASGFEVSEPAGAVGSGGPAPEEPGGGIPAWAIGAMAAMLAVAVAWFAWPWRPSTRNREQPTTEIPEVDREQEAPGEQEADEGGAEREREPAGVR